ncbi:unnamed protein product [Leptidea sinapis]|uniref:Uncharacterized protein n=1 Tax=Leptidea sinapis TaxID=189913 RepID=A0A5E4PNT8_9NEOP|nr:unnamed protein product [Leptidea sinapis]
MPFIEDEWWAAENEGRMVDLSNCIQDAVAASGQSAAQMQLQMATSLGELTQTEISNFVGGLTLEADSSEAADPDDILKQLGETAFDNFDTFFTDLTNSTASAVPPIEIKQEENNNISSASGSQLSYYQQNNQIVLPGNGQQRLQQLLRSGTSAINNAVTNNINNGRYNIASANPLLAEKLAATSSGIKQEPNSSEYNGSMNYGSASPMQRVPSGKPQIHDAGGGKWCNLWNVRWVPGITCPLASGDASGAPGQGQLFIVKTVNKSCAGNDFHLGFVLENEFTLHNMTF